MKSFARTIVLPLVFLAFASPVRAWPIIDVTASETLSATPLRVKTTFTYEDVGYRPCCYSVDLLVSSSGAGPAVHFFAGESEPAWTPYLPQGDALVYFQHVNIDAYVGLHAFSIVTDQAIPCVELRFWDYLLSKTPTTNSDYVIEACLAVDMPVPAGPASWGSVKSRYR